MSEVTIRSFVVDNLSASFPAPASIGKNAMPFMPDEPGFSHEGDDEEDDEEEDDNDPKTPKPTRPRVTPKRETKKPAEEGAEED